MHRLHFIIYIYYLFYVLIGVQSYTYEGTISCSINWAGQTKNDFYYNIVIFAAGFIAPLLIIVIADGYIFVYVS